MGSEKRANKSEAAEETTGAALVAGAGAGAVLALMEDDEAVDGVTAVVPVCDLP